MRIRFTRRGLLLMVLVILGTGIGAMLVAKPWIEAKLIRTLEAQGFRNVKLKVSHLGLRGIVLENISLGEGTPLSLKHVSVDYSLTDLRAKRVGGFTVEGLTLTGYQNDTSWGVGGLEALMQKSPGEAATIPVTRAELVALPLSSFTVKDSRFVLDTGRLAVNMPVALTWRMEPKPAVHYEAPGWDIKTPDMAFQSGRVAIDASLDEEQKRWNGTWMIEGIGLSGAPVVLPVLQAKGTVSAEGGRVILKGRIADAKNAYHADFGFSYDLAGKNLPVLTVSNLRLPWNKGIVGLDAARLPMGKNQTTRFTLTVEKVSIAELMKSLTGERATGTGAVSGRIPVTIRGDGQIILDEGSLHAEEPGVISIAPETIPGDSKQVALVRDVLKNLHYTLLTIAVDSNDDHKLSVKMAVEGRNPDVSQGKPVRLNVQLNGDVLNLIQQNVTAITNPEHLLEQDSQ